MIDPVMAADGHAYERTAIERWLATKSTSPMTGEALEHTFRSPSHMVRRQIREWQQAHPGQEDEHSEHPFSALAVALLRKSMGEDKVTQNLRG
ncbi:hypothetical protein EMIHUDRAFT_233729 [Emiliania huxleyi CCMP1516]|uniref:U-box domain-containing protein n=2 Tax=Emiliania huxleyi TaxID=2903 RepID=A0A0D3K1K9_EMIH1|nr:hypothetical protein EMIHUDRAFT_233729 [Emiliania huxleyi CCMP1516]EOD29644.1 hypothetical protein EMIHUDRAFT_233729 [Emiliania huxleyi CCMP1516]|eukprot:XP_005782073.1 hypothetical protein EMIHUDRAFT_233729 [Emiliania huxleyi CCMP1516]